MLSLAAFRYRNVLTATGGPVERIEVGSLNVRGRSLFLANAWLKPGLVRPRPAALFSDAAGTGTHETAGVARHKAVSEALERWAFHTVVRSERAAEFGFDIDPSSTGMSAFPGVRRRNSRHTSLLEAVERFSLCAWWEGHIGGRHFETDWPGVSAIAIDSPVGGVTVVVYARSEWGDYVYGHAAEESFGAACEHAVVELARHESVLRAWRLRSAAWDRPQPTHIFEQRCLFFASEEGHEVFQQRLRQKPAGRTVGPEVICDREIPGPWTEYASIWRFVFRPLSDGYRCGGERYFFL